MITPGTDRERKVRIARVLDDGLVDAVRAPGVGDVAVDREHSAIRALRAFLLTEKGLPKEDAYISGYWKIGLIEDAHQALKRTEAA